jgi:hypothetical protein
VVHEVAEGIEIEGTRWAANDLVEDLCKLFGEFVPGFLSRREQDLGL